MSKELRVGLIGYGFAGKTFHAPVITAVPGLRLAKVVERKSELSKVRYSWVDVVGSVEELYADPTIDLVVVTTPSTNHVEFTRDALLAGKHVVVEKPFTATSEEAEQLIELAKSQGKMLSVFHNRRWDGDFLTVKSIVEQGLLGELAECEFRWDGFNPIMKSDNWRDQSGPATGVFYDLGSHFIDQALQLFGVPETISGDIRVTREGGITDDYFDVALGYPGNLKVVMKSSRFVRERSPRYTLYGSKGSFVKYGTDPQEAALIAGGSPGESAHWGKESREWWGTINTSAGNLHVEGLVETLPGSYTSYYENVYRHIVGLEELAVKPEEALQTIRLIELAYLSHAEQRTIKV
ncbi:oxidoreductase [Paenibacillus sp. LHD-117]|uniref:oxidoreductase n=1 Tax=Paenibacillus sp. LHD-117 TaxID=3071412 RepID=UPI0027E1BFE0|nr:oxidoreductase [Paenibacillus sp. LHD-117]MDQ6422864.1 oxidoreductase [Paenibacillus sp. LHD-117]